MRDSRHLANFSLLLSFIALAISGVLSFVRPFSLLTTRVHVVFGLLTLLLVGVHLVARSSYFRTQLSRLQRDRRFLISTFVTGAIASLSLYLTIYEIEPVGSFLALAYETRSRDQIVRASPLVGLLSEDEQRLVHREPGPGADVQVSLLVRFGKQLNSSTAAESKSASLAIWAETVTGTMIETLYLDTELAFSDRPMWNGVTTSRANILPIWRHRYTAISGVDPAGEVDAVTGATPSHSFSLTDYLHLGQKKEFVLCVEVNAAADPSEEFPDPHIGQPSLLYTALVDVDSREKYQILALTGHGGGAEESGAIQYDLERITTAQDWLDLVLLNVTSEF